jgi:hypothetical protein
MAGLGGEMGGKRNFDYLPSGLSQFCCRWNPEKFFDRYIITLLLHESYGEMWLQLAADESLHWLSRIAASMLIS